ncbi:hypothetical protein JCM33374_g4284 [Metschnikowia sp. JCM 33374]|nr:hypothetical protein JCM33374_g4284 [Metschnikowia sp. JCM 33374]
MFKRSISTSARVLQGKVFPKINNVEELGSFLNKSQGNVHDMLPGPTSVVDSKIVRKMLRLSGLESDISPETEHKWINALNTQIGFINKLQSSEQGDKVAQKTNAQVFRLIASDHQPDKAIGLEQLMNQVGENHQTIGEEKFSDFDKSINSTVKV